MGYMLFMLIRYRNSFLRQVPRIFDGRLRRRSSEDKMAGHCLRIGYLRTIHSVLQRNGVRYCSSIERRIGIQSRFIVSTNIPTIKRLICL